jgi:hypothetical protein
MDPEDIANDMLPDWIKSVLDEVTEPIATVDLLDFTHDTLGSEASDWQREIYVYLKKRGMILENRYFQVFSRGGAGIAAILTLPAGQPSRIIDTMKSRKRLPDANFGTKEISREEFDSLKEAGTRDISWMP